MPIREEQRVIVAWMRCQLERLNWVPERWAQAAHLSPTTVTRAMSERYDSVSSVTTLHALARAAGVPSVIDFLAAQAEIQERKFPILTAMLEEVLPKVGCHLATAQVERLGEALGTALAGLPPESNDALSQELMAAAKGTLDDH